MRAITLHQVSKSYRAYAHARDRFWELLTQRQRHQERVALHPVSLDIGSGEVVGVIGVNGAGKSTLLKLIAGTLKPTTGEVTLQGHVCALLELGAGFHPEMSGLDNIYLGGAVSGLPTAKMDGLVEGIIQFSGLREVIDQPVKTYSSGMTTRLAFAVATAVDPDVLILDETLSVGDGNFAKKSFERIMGFKQAGKTILFCSHSMYQVQAICSRVLWLEHGQLRMDGDPAEVVSAYCEFMESLDEPSDGPAASAMPEVVHPLGKYRLVKVVVDAEGVTGSRIAIVSGREDVRVTVAFASDPAGPAPCIAIMVVAANGRPVASASTLNDGFMPRRDADGRGRVAIHFPRFPLLKGAYWVHVFLLCDKGLMVHDKARMVAELVVSQTTLEQGIVTLPHDWSDGPSLTPDSESPSALT